MRLRIGITDNLRPKPQFENYTRWIHSVAPDAEFVKLSYHLDNASKVGEIDGLILTGGGDVHPALYGKGQFLEQTEEVNERRDEFEFTVIEKALETDLPILGICRGMQVMNVYLGGTLVIDLPTAGFRDHAERSEGEKRHSINPVPNSLFEILVGSNAHEVNSVHHQAVEHLGKGLMASAVSDDGLIEAAEWILKDRMPFLLLVQWHPEQMKDAASPCARTIAEFFLKEIAVSINNQRPHPSDQETE